MSFNCGIVGLPNVGKSTLFNALTKTAIAQAANYPFCTIEPNVGRIAVPDLRLYKLAKIANSKTTIPTSLEFIDIAGLVKGASKGEGLGNQFLGHIRSTSTIIQVLRCFEDENITHVEGNIDPIRDMELIETELLLSDLESLNKQIISLEKKSKTNDKESKEKLEAFLSIIKDVENGIMIRDINFVNSNQRFFDQFLTFKPILYVCNVSDLNKNNYVDSVKKLKTNVICVCAEIESEIAQIEDEAERQNFLKDLGLNESGLSLIIKKGYEMLDLITFFTIGPKEARAWTIQKGTKAPKAASVIHTDFERGFICSEVTSFDDYVNCNGEIGSKNQGKTRIEGKEYVMNDADIVHFRFNV